jgi:ParB family chromosome partitioning protein
MELILEPPAPMRASMDEEKLYELRDSLRAKGQLQPIIVYPQADKFEIAAGHRRFLAARLVPFLTIECKVYEDSEMAREAAMLTENAFREEVTPAEEGWKYCEIVEKYKCTEAELCAMVGHNPEYIYARMDMVKADEVVARLNAARKITFTVAKELLKCKDVAHRHYLATMAAESGATGNVVKSWVAQYIAQQQGTIEMPPPTTVPDAGTPPVENHMKCWCCGGEKDPQNLRMIYLHWYEMEGLQRVLIEAGLKPGAPTA